MFLNVCIFVSLWGPKCIFTTGGSVEEARSIEATMEAYEEFIQRVKTFTDSVRCRVIWVGIKRCSCLQKVPLLGAK